RCKACPMEVADVEGGAQSGPGPVPERKPADLSDHVAAGLTGPYAVALHFVDRQSAWRRGVFDHPFDGLIPRPAPAVNPGVGDQPSGAEQRAPDIADAA